MEFVVGDKVVHPRYGAGRIARVEQWEAADGGTSYYVIEIPGQGLTVHVPVLKAEEAGMRPAIAPARLPQVLSTLRSSPLRLPDDNKERQEQIWATVKTGTAMLLATVVRDLTWHNQRAHLTKRDSELLKKGQDLLAAEMALVTGDNLSATNKAIGATMTAAVAASAS